MSFIVFAVSSYEITKLLIEEAPLLFNNVSFEAEDNTIFSKSKERFPLSVFTSYLYFSLNANVLNRLI